MAAGTDVSQPAVVHVCPFSTIVIFDTALSSGSQRHCLFACDFSPAGGSAANHDSWAAEALAEARPISRHPYGAPTAVCLGPGGRSAFRTFSARSEEIDSLLMFPWFPSSFSKRNNMLPLDDPLRQLGFYSVPNDARVFVDTSTVVGF